MGKIIRRTLTALLIVIFSLSAAIVGAKIQMYTATGEDYANEVESQDIAKLRARDKAIKKATKQAGVYLKTYSRSVNSELTDDEVTAITSNAWQLVSEPKYSSKIVKGSDETSIIIWTATVEVNVDDSEIQSWIKRDDKEKSTIIIQTREVQKASEENERKIEDLREKYNRATNQAEKIRIRKQMDLTDRDFLANQKINDSLKLFFDKNFDEAINLCNEALQLKPNYNLAYACRGIIYSFGLKNPRLAIQDFDEVIKSEPGSPEIYFIRGISYIQLAQYDSAMQDFNKSLDLGFNSPLAYSARGSMYFQKEQYERAIQDFNKAIELEPNLQIAYAGRGASYQRLKKDSIAIQDLDIAIQLNPNDSIAFYNRGRAHLNLKQYEQAISDFDRTIQINPFYKFAYLYRGRVYFNMKNYEQAIKDYNRTIKIDPNYDIAYNRRGLAYDKLEKYELAIQDYSKALELDPNFKVAYYNRGLAYRKLNKHQQALADFNKYIQLVPNDYDGWQMRGKCYQALGEEAKAQSDFAKAKELGYNG